jgi:hypothetical protein
MSWNTTAAEKDYPLFLPAISNLNIEQDKIIHSQETTTLKLASPNL